MTWMTRLRAKELLVIVVAGALAAGCFTRTIVAGPVVTPAAVASIRNTEEQHDLEVLVQRPVRAWPGEAVVPIGAPREPASVCCWASRWGCCCIWTPLPVPGELGLFQRIRCCPPRRSCRRRSRDVDRRADRRYGSDFQNSRLRAGCGAKLPRWPPVAG